MMKNSDILYIYFMLEKRGVTGNTIRSMMKLMDKIFKSSESIYFPTNWSKISPHNIHLRV